MHNSPVQQRFQPGLFLAVLATTIVPAVIFAGLVPVNTGRMTAFYAISRQQLGYWLMVALVVSCPAGLLAGYFAAVFGAVMVLAASQLLIGVGLVSYGLFPHSSPLLVASVVAVMLGNMFVGIGNKMAVDLMPGNAGRGANLLHGVNALGKFVGPLIASLFVDYSWRLGFGATAALPLLLAVFVSDSAGTIVKPKSPHPLARPARCWLIGITGLE